MSSKSKSSKRKNQELNYNNVVRIDNKKKDFKGKMSKKLMSLYKKISDNAHIFNKGVGKKIRNNLILINLKEISYADGDAIVVKRKKELKELFNIIGKRNNRNVIILGDTGTDKEQIIEGLVQSVKKGTCPSKFKDSLVLEVPIEQFSSETNAANEIEMKILELIEIAQNYPNTILYIKNIIKLIDYQIMDTFQMVFDNAICICIMDSIEDINFDFTKFHFMYFNVEEPKRDDLYYLIGGRLAGIEKFHKVKISEEAFNQILYQSFMTTYDTKITDVLDIADEAASIAENRNLQDVDIRSIIETNRDNIDAMLRRSKSQNEFYAIHEAGHAVVALHYNVVINAISIIPDDNEESDGYNLLEENENSLDSKEDLLRNIDIALGGYASTLIKGFPLTYGAINDLTQVNRLERAMFLYLGMEDGKPISYLDESGKLELTYLSNEMKNELGRKVERNISERLEKTIEIINKDMDKLNVFASALQKKGFLTQNEVLSLDKGEITLDDIPELRTLIFDD